MRKIVPFAAAALSGAVLAVGVQNANRVVPDSCAKPVTALGQQNPVVEALNVYMAQRVTEDVKLTGISKVVADYQIASGAFTRGDKPDASHVELTIILFRGNFPPVSYIVEMEFTCDGWKVEKFQQTSLA